MFWSILLTQHSMLHSLFTIEVNQGVEYIWCQLYTQGWNASGPKWAAFSQGLGGLPAVAFLFLLTLCMSICLCEKAVIIFYPTIRESINTLSLLCFSDWNIWLKNMVLLPSTIILWLFALLCLHGISASDVKSSFYTQTNISCHATENIDNIPEIRCAAKCSTQKERPCIGFSHNETNCELCMVCSNSSNYKPLNSGRTTYSSAENFPVEHDKG